MLKNKIIWGALLCFIASASWGAMFPVANSAFKNIDPFYFTLIRYVSVTVLLVVILLFKEGTKAFRFEKRGLSLWFFGTMAFVVYNLFIFWGQDLMGQPGTMVASVSEAMMPMISIVIVWIISRHKPHGFTLTCVFTAFVGVMLVITKGDLRTFLTATDDIVPSLLIFLAVIGWVIYTMGGNHFSEWSALRYSTLSCLLGTLTACIVVFFVTLTGYISVPTVETLQIVTPHMLFMIVFPGIIALVGWNVGVRILSPLNGLLFINFVPVTTLVISYMQGYQLTIFDYVGTAFIIAALLGNNIFLRLQQKRKDESRQYKKHNVQPSV
ncbi:MULTISPECIES: DMT family transporter [Sporosarcina]|uniref:DMT family transporter n=1 Tax=Sporosarcina TaxID=1569 RepID=UPI0018DB7407|nr:MULTISPECIES: DMT family transporter [Sporosarcina]